MKVPFEFYDLLRNRINLSEIVRQKVVLTKKSGNYLGLCPFHKEKTPSFTVNDNKKFYYCFGCAASGDVIKFNSQINGLSYQESAIGLANDAGIAIPQLTYEQKKIYEESDQILDILELANKFFQFHLSPEILNYLNARGITSATIKEFSIGFAPSNKQLQRFFEEKSIPLMSLEKAGLVARKDDGKMYEVFYDRVTFPIRNIYNKIVGFGGRVIGSGLPKYLNSPETIIFQKNEILYGENKAISSAYKKNYSILVEGYLDVIALHQAGFTEAAASLGTAVSENHLQKLWRAGDEIILCLDGDGAGIKATMRVINLALPLLSNNRKISFIRLPSNSDPDDVINKNGAKFFEKLLDKRVSLSEMIWLMEYEGKTFKTAEDKATLEKKLQNYCFQIKDLTLKNSYQRFFKDQIWQNLIKHSSKVNLINSRILPTGADYSELEILEHAFCAILIKLPEMLKNDKIKDFITTLNFQNNMLSEFRDWYFEKIINNNLVDIEKIREIVEKTRFFDSFLLLSESKNRFLDLSFKKNNRLLSKFATSKEFGKESNDQPDIFWEWLYKKYYLILLKNEYASAIAGGNDDDFEKAALYHQEILQLSKELQVLNESFSINM